MIEKKKTRKNSWHRATIKKAIGEDATVDDVLTYLCGDADGSTSDFVLYEYDSSSRTLFNRLNMLWVWPVFALLALPCWLIRGEIGVNRNSKIGKVVNWLVAFDT